MSSWPLHRRRDRAHLDGLAQRQRQAVVVGVDPSPAAVDLATHRLAGRPVSFIVGTSRIFPGYVKADAAFFCNAIHLVADKESCVAALAEALPVGGVLACNTTFYEGAYVPGSEPFYFALTRQSIGWLRAHHPEVRVAHRGKVTARQWNSAEEYRAIVGGHGLEVTYLEEVPVQFPLRPSRTFGGTRSSLKERCQGSRCRLVLRRSQRPQRQRSLTCT